MKMSNYDALNVNATHLAWYYDNGLIGHKLLFIKGWICLTSLNFLYMYSWLERACQCDAPLSGLTPCGALFLIWIRIWTWIWIHERRYICSSSCCNIVQVVVGMAVVGQRVVGGWWWCTSRPQVGSGIPRAAPYRWWRNCKTALLKHQESSHRGLHGISPNKQLQLSIISYFKFQHCRITSIWFYHIAFKFS